MYGTKKSYIKMFACLLLASFIVILQAAASVQASSPDSIYDSIDDIVGGFTPPKDTTIIHHSGTAEKPYTKIANAVSELWVGDHHRYTVVENQQENVKIRWYSSDPEVADINKATGELTALSAGTTTITMWDRVNKTKQKAMLTVKAVPVLPEIPREWYIIAEKPDWISEEGIQLVLKPEYRYLYEQCTMLRIPESVDGKNVVSLHMKEITGSNPSFKSFGFKQLKMLQCPKQIEYLVNESLLEEMVYSEKLQWLTSDYYCKRIHMPESVELILCDALGGKELSEVRIPAGVKLICRDVYWDSGWGVERGENVRFVVDGNNTSYYSVSDVLFAYPYDTKEGANGYIYVEPYYGMECGRYALLAYPREKTDEVYYVPDGIERIEASAFKEAQYLRKIVLPDSVTEIGEHAFLWIPNEVEITIPASVTKFEDSGYGGPFGIISKWWDTRKITIITPKGSAAEAYAIKYMINYRNE